MARPKNTGAIIMKRVAAGGKKNTIIDGNIIAVNVFLKRNMNKSNSNIHTPLK